MNEQNLKNFENDIAVLYESGQIKAPVHLRDGNEHYLIDLFENIFRNDYVFSTWASHTHALLKGVDPNRIKHDILQGRSITLHYPDYNFYSSAIVGGICPISVGVAHGLKKQKKNNRVYCFLGDMAFHTGIAYESIKYAIGHSLPITFIVEDNGKSVATPTESTWKISTYKLYELYIKMINHNQNVKLKYYKYDLTYPHSGCGTFVEF